MKKKYNNYSSKTSYYLKYRPNYPSDILKLLNKEIGFDEFKNVADIGSGTGLLSKLFLLNGNIVFGVEPNDEMREAAEKYLEDFDNFVSINGTAEDTKLMDKTADLIVCGQSFHWFDTKLAKKEFKRILNRGGYVVLIWNERDRKKNPFMKEYDELLLKHYKEYKEILKKSPTKKTFDNFYGINNYKYATFSNYQTFDLEGIKGRLLSTSFVDVNDKNILNELTNIFKKYAKCDRIKFDYTTKVYYGKINK